MTGRTVRRLGSTGVEVVESLHRHRLLSTCQIHALHMPHASLRWAQSLMARLGAMGFVAYVALPGGLRLWYLTKSGLGVVEAVANHAESRRRAICPEQAAGPLQEHTLAVNEVGVSFVRAAREREGDECGPFDWHHEVAHPLGPPPGRRTPEQLICDATLTYQLAEAGGAISMVYRFIELDRATRSTADLARQLGRYGRLYRRRVPAEGSKGATVRLWSRLYPVFPAVLVVLAGPSSERLESRRRTVLALCRQDPDLAEAPQVEVSICLLDDLLAHGPFAPICRSLADPDRPVDWLGEEVG